MRVEFKKVKIEILQMDEENLRKHPDRNRAAISASLKEFGQVEALVVQKGTNRVLGGNARLEELKKIGEKEVWISEIDISDEKAVKLALALNRVGELAEWDESALSSILTQIDNDELISSLFSEHELENIVSPLEDLSWGGLTGEKKKPDSSRVTVDITINVEQSFVIERALRLAQEQNFLSTRGQALEEICQKYLGEGHGG